MPVRFEVKLAKIGNSLRVTIPKPIADALGLNSGETVAIWVTDSEIRIRKEDKRRKKS
jgi:AbrB family looped-hinge helix DNA binding protein